MTYYGLTTQNASTLFGSLNNNSSNSMSSMYSLAGNMSTLKIQAKYMSKMPNTSNDYYSKLVNKKEEAAEAEGIKDSASSIQNALSQLTSKGTTSIFNQYTGKAEDAEAIKSATLKGLASTADKSIELDIKQVATTQKNIGNNVVSKDKDLDNGTYSFDLKINDKTHKISFKVESKDDNASIQKKIAEAINKNDIGVTAKVNTNENKSYLSIESNETGKTKSGNDVLFTISGMSNKALDEKFGLSIINQKAQNAIYSVNNGADIESRSNNVKLYNGAEVEFNKATNGNTKISFTADEEGAKNKVKSFITDFNSALSGFDSTKAYNAISSLTKSYSRSLEAVGIKVSSTGHLSINEDKFNKASFEDIKKVFTNNGSFGSALNKKATEIAISPQRFLDSTSSTSGLYNSSGYFANGNSSSSLLDYLF